MVYLSKVGNSYNIPAQHYICDSSTDFSELEQNSTIPIGSTALIIDQQTTMEKGESGWCVLSSGGGGGTKIIYIEEKVPWAHDQGRRF